MNAKLKNLILYKEFYPCKINKNFNFKLNDLFWISEFNAIFHCIFINDEKLILKNKNNGHKLENYEFNEGDFILFPFTYDFYNPNFNISYRGSEIKALIELDCFDEKDTELLKEIYIYDNILKDNIYYFIRYRKDDGSIFLNRDLLKSPKINL